MSLDLHYCRGTPPESDFEAVKMIDALDEKTFELLATNLCNVKDKQKEELISILASKNSLSEEELSKNLNILQSIFQGFVKKKISKNIALQDLTTLGLKEKYSNILTNKIDENKDRFIGAPCTFDSFVDVQWKFGITVSSSDVNKLSNTFIDLNLVTNKDNSTQNIFLELTLPEFYNLLNELESAKLILDQHFN